LTFFVYYGNAAVPNWFYTGLDILATPKRIATGILKQKSFKFAKLKIQYFLTVSSGRVLISLVLLSLQCWRRLYETTCVSVFSNGKINIAQYLAGFIHYAAAAAAIVAEAPVFASKGKTGKT
jgi:hypothetical protein